MEDEELEEVVDGTGEEQGLHARRSVFGEDALDVERAARRADASFLRGSRSLRAIFCKFDLCVYACVPGVLLGARAQTCYIYMRVRGTEVVRPLLLSEITRIADEAQSRGQAAKDVCRTARDNKGGEVDTRQQRKGC